MEFASNGKANAALTTGIIGTVGTGLSLLGGGLNNLWGNNGAGLINAAATMFCGDNTPVSRYEMEMSQRLAMKDAEIALLKSEQNTEVKIADVFERLITRINADQKMQSDWNAQQMVNNTRMSASIAANANSIAGLQHVVSHITKTVVPNYAICPGWGEVTVTPVTPTADAGTTPTA